MSLFDEHQEDSLQIPAEAPLLPLPDCVLFPQIVQPLHIFEPRYRALVADSLRGDRLLVLCLLRPGYEKLYDTKQAPCHPMGCLAKITAHRELPDGRYVLIVRGLARVQVSSEVDAVQLYRIGRIERRPDQYPPTSPIDRPQRRDELLRLFFEQFPDLEHDSTMAPLLRSEVSLGTLCDLLAYTSRMDPHELIQVLDCTDVDRRSTVVLQLLKERARSANRLPIPPPFSLN